MEHFIKNLVIENFKTIERLEMNCKKVNVFIGKPNVGKSNILEALGLFCPDILGSYPFKHLIRYQSATNIFRDDNTENDVIVKTDTESVSLKMTGFEKFFWEKNNVELAKDFIQFNGKLRNEDENKHILDKNPFVNFKKYQYKTFENESEYKESYYLSSSLDYPNGKNLFEVIRKNKELWKEFAQIFAGYGLKLVYDTREKIFEVQKEIDGIVNSYPYLHTADTLLRYIFYTTAIRSNQNNILVLEEPEVHSFPPYIRRLANDIMEDKNNQFFITTHSPYMLELLMENIPFENLSINVVFYEDNQTKIHTLSKEDIWELLNYATDIFLNMDRFEKAMIKA